MPDVPTVAEAGVPGFALDTWIGLFAPAKTPPEIVTKVNAEVSRILALPDVRARLVPQGIDLSTGSPEELAGLVREDHARWGRVIREAGVKAE
jgi:tripartite-type tricarboxylate transporter receptor subunit TctC